jgi:CRISPR-associated endonuclease Csn1
MSSAIETIKNGEEKFKQLGMEDQLKVLGELLKLMSCNSVNVNLTLIGGSANMGKGSFSNNISTLDSCKLIYQSPTGIYEKIIDLKTINAKT